MADGIFSFGPFQLFPDQLLLLENDDRLAIGHRALNILIVLVKHAGELVLADDIRAEVWPDTFVADGSLRVHIAGLRKALGDGQGGARYIVNEPTRGYRFVAPVSWKPSSAGAPYRPEARHRIELPLPLTRLLGRSDELEGLCDRLARQRFITVVGPGGIGKTSLAVAAGARRADVYSDGACFVDLASLNDAELAPSALASALQVPVGQGAPATGLVAALREKRMLIVLDGCEHVIEGATALAEALLKNCAGISILATSREPLLGDGETLQHLGPLANAPDLLALDAATAASFSAVQLFVERAVAGLDTFVLTDANAPLVADLCRKLDGLPLAIELAAACVGAFGLSGLAGAIDDRLALLVRGRRTTRRHQTLRAMLDWSYEVLLEAEQTVLSRLSILRAGFTLDAAIAVTAAAPISRADVLECLSNLSAKSLVAADVSGAVVQYRLLDTTRSYALDKLASSGQLTATATRHAKHLRASFGQAESDWRSLPRLEWWDRYGRQIDDVRAALDWAFSDTGDLRIGVSLTAESAPLWIGLSKLEEYASRVRLALDRIARSGIAAQAEEMRLTLCLVATMFNSLGPGGEYVSTLHRALEMAERLGDTAGQITALWSLMGVNYIIGDYPKMLGYAQQVEIRGDRDHDLESAPMADRVLALSHYALGHHAEARRLGERSIGIRASSAASFKMAFRYDHTTASRANLASVLWIQGYADQAREMIEGAVSDALTIRNPSSLCYILAFTACPVALWMGADAAAERFNRHLLNQAAENAFGWMQSWGRDYADVLASRCGLPSESRDSPGEHVSGLSPLQKEILISVDQSLVDEASVVRARRLEQGWSRAEVLRAEGERIAGGPGDKAIATAEALFMTAMDIAASQGALAWELRAAASLARLQRDTLGIREARNTLEPVLDRIHEGFDTADVLAAAALLATLS
jgi:predicted ATPase/DNA-binding winged helix-turn-helix (wHTH) protein